jgi:hypothetical protein
MGAKLTVDGGLLKVADAENVTAYFREQVLAQQAEIVVWLRIIGGCQETLRSQEACGGRLEAAHGPYAAAVARSVIPAEKAQEIDSCEFDFGER